MESPNVMGLVVKRRAQKSHNIRRRGKRKKERKKRHRDGECVAVVCKCWAIAQVFRSVVFFSASVDRKLGIARMRSRQRARRRKSTSQIAYSDIHALPRKSIKSRTGLHITATEDIGSTNRERTRRSLFLVRKLIILPICT